MEDVNRYLSGWYAYYKHSCEWAMKMSDGHVRVRLRNLLRGREGKRGHAHHRHSDHVKWPNRYFHKRGLFSLAEARLDDLSPQGGH